MSLPSSFTIVQGLHNQAFGKHNGHWERGLRSGKNSARLLYALCIQHKWRAGSGENYLRYPSRPVSLVEGTEEGVPRLLLAFERVSG